MAESAVKVCVRVRPLIAREESVSENSDPVPLYWRADEKSIHQIDDGNTVKTFSFDRVFRSEETTNQLYQDFAKPLVISTVEGYNGTIFAYGQTSSGKTFTMMGSDHNPGVIPLAVADVFQTIKNFPTKEFLLRVSYMEIYNETVSDLLVDGWKRKPLEVREAINKTIYVADLTEELVTTTAQALAWIRKGEKSRHYEKTKMNQRSSRSHTIFRMILESRERGENADGAIIVSHLNLVDLAGSERASQTGAEGTRFKEGCNINLSLFTLGQVIKKLAESQKGFTNYRDSKLTRILQNSLGGNAKTVIICTITPVTLDETLGTLQFASAAKKMKNDPHVTEVSDDGALLKRYRNEIADLKKRLNEVSSVTQTTATEKQFLSQLLQEKDQLQREQQDKIRNLTTLLVTSSTSIAVKFPKRRVTWGGNMLRLFGPGISEESFADHSFVETSRKNKTSCSVLTETAYDEEFDSCWGIPDEPSDDSDTSASAVTTRRFGERLDERVAELERQLQTRDEEKQEFVDKLQESEQKAAELEQQATSEAQQKQEAVEKIQMLELNVADLGHRLDQQMEVDKQTRKEFAQTLQICESLASEKDTVVTELDYLKQELCMFVEQNHTLERENVSLSLELKDKNELDEFKALEDEARKEHQVELEIEISQLKKDLETSELKHVELQQKCEALREELMKKTEFAENLQAMNGKDLVQEVANLRRSLDDAQGVSRETKKEWAMLRSRNITLEEMQTTLSAEHKEMETEVTSQRLQLEGEKSRFKKMQTDLQKELNTVFDENSKLTTLLDGKVPRNLIDSVELERTVRNLNQEVASHQEAERTLRAQLDQLSSLGDLPEKVDTLMKEVSELSEKLCGVEAQRDTLLAEQTNSQEVNEHLQSSLNATQKSLVEAQEAHSAAEHREQDLSQKYSEVVQQLEALTSDKERLEAEKNHHLATIADISLKIESLTEELQKAQSKNDRTEFSSEEKEQMLSTVTMLTEERDQLKMDMQDNVEMMIENQAELLGNLEAINKEKEKNKQLHSQITSLKEKLEVAEAAIDRLEKGQCETISEEVEMLQRRVDVVTEERDQLLETLDSLRQEKRQLRSEMEDDAATLHVEVSELKTFIQTLTEQKTRLEDKLLETSSESSRMQDLLKSVQDEPLSQKQATTTQVNSLELQITSLKEKLEVAEAEIDRMEAEHHQTISEEVEMLQRRVDVVTEERDQLLETLDSLRQEKRQLRSEMEDDAATLHVEVSELKTFIQTLTEQKTRLEDKLLETSSESSRMQDLLKSVQDEPLSQKQATTTQVSSLELQITSLKEKLEVAEAEIDRMEAEHHQTNSEEVEMLQRRVDVVTEERDQLLETLDSLRQEKRQLRSEMEDDAATLHVESSRMQALLKSVQDELLSQKQATTTQVNSLELQITSLKEKLEVAEAKIDRMEAEHRQTNSEEEEMLQRRVDVVTEERDQLLETLDSLRQEKRQLRSEMEDDAATLHVEVSELKTFIQTLTEQKTRLEDKLLETSSESSRMQDLLKSVQDELLSQKQATTTQVNSLELQITSLKEKLEVAEAKIDRMEAEHHQTISEEVEMLQRRVDVVTEERDQLLETLDSLRQEKRELRSKMEDEAAALRAYAIRTLHEKLTVAAEKELNCQTLRKEAETLQKGLMLLTEERDRLQDTLNSQSQLEANPKIKASVLLQESTVKLQELYEVLERLFESCSQSAALAENRKVEWTLEPSHFKSLPKSFMKTYIYICHLGQKNFDTLGNILMNVNLFGKRYKKLLEQLVKNDVAMFEEQRVQDTMLMRVQAPAYSVKDEDLSLVWEQRLAAIVDKRQLFMQKIGQNLEKLLAYESYYPSQFSAENHAMGKFSEQLKDPNTNEVVDPASMERIFNTEQERRLEVTERTKRMLKDIIDEQTEQSDDLWRLTAEAAALLKEETSKRVTLQQALGAAEVKPELSLLNENHQLSLMLQDARGKVEALSKQSEEVEIQANERLSNHKQATQLLQTELQDSRAHAEEKETLIQNLKSKLRESEKNVPPSTIELQELRNKLFKMELEMSFASEKHQQEIQRLNTLLTTKEQSLRRLKENLRQSHQQEDTFNQGKELHAKLVDPRGAVIKSSLNMEKVKLEEEVKELKRRITELESMLSNQDTEIGKWKSRAHKMKTKIKPASPEPLTSTKRAFPYPPDSMNSPKKFQPTPRKVLDSPMKTLNSPRAALVSSPKKSFFEVGVGSSELPSRSCPKQFFDNSGLGNIPGAAGADKPEEWWAQSPKHDDICKTQ